MSFTSAIKSAFNFKNDAHALASGLTTLHKALQYVEDKGAEFLTSGAEEKIEAVTSVVPGIGAKAVVIERAAFSSLGIILTLVKQLDSADQAALAALQANLANAGLDKDTIAAFTQFSKDFAGDLASVGVKL